MAGWQPSFAMRDLRSHLGAPFVLAAQAGIALILWISGPFGTLDSLPALPRLLYWVGIVFGTYALGSTLTLMVLERLDQKSRWPLALQVLRGGVIIGLAVVAFLLAWNMPFFGRNRLSAQVTGTGIMAAFMVSWVVLGLRAILRSAAAPEITDPDMPQRPAISQRLPLEKRGALIALSATDHYVEVITENGRALVLMRLADAISETAPIRGLQVHRSHWVALAQVKKVTRRGDGACLDMGSGLEIPVSRRHMSTIRAAGLLPQKQG